MFSRLPPWLWSCMGSCFYKLICLRTRLNWSSSFPKLHMHRSSTRKMICSPQLLLYLKNNCAGRFVMSECSPSWARVISITLSPPFLLWLRLYCLSDFWCAIFWLLCSEYCGNITKNFFGQCLSISLSLLKNRVFGHRKLFSGYPVATSFVLLHFSSLAWGLPSRAFSKWANYINLSGHPSILLYLPNIL